MVHEDRAIGYRVINQLITRGPPYRISQFLTLSGYKNPVIKYGLLENPQFTSKFNDVLIQSSIPTGG